MDWMNKVGGILSQYAESKGNRATPQGISQVTTQSAPEVDQHFDSVSQQVPQNVLAQGLTAAFSSTQTPSFGEMVGNLFSRSNPDQKAGLVSRLLSQGGPAITALMASKGLSNLMSGSGEVNPQAATQLSPETVTELASRAEKQNPSIVESVSSFYAQHPTLVKTLGAAALAIAMSKMSSRAA